MKYSRLIKLLNNKYNYLSYKELKNIVDEIFNFIKQKTKDGYRIEVRGFGMFEAKEYKAKNYFNPKTQEYSSISKRLVPFYKASMVLKRSVNKDNP